MHRFVIAVLAVMLASTVALAEIPQVLGYQGRVTDNSGVPVSDGTYTMRFRIYTAETGGTLLWDSNNRSVALAGGIFNVMLGESPQPTLSLDFDQDYWLSVQFDGEYQNPRKRLGSVGYAYMASGLVPGTEVSGSVSSAAAIKGTNASTDGYGVHGYVSATTGYTYAGWFESVSITGRGVYGRASANTGFATYGVFGHSTSGAGRGVYGYASCTSGDTQGVYGTSLSTDGQGVYGWAYADSGTTDGVHGLSSSTDGRGVRGHASATSGTTRGVYGSSSSTEGSGVYGYAFATTGTTYGVFGRSDATAGAAVRGWADANTGTADGVYGRSNSPDGYGIYYSGGLSGTGSKSCVVKTSRGPTLLYCQESPENWFEDFGEGQLANGRCHIELEPLFLETVTIDDASPMKVFVQPDDPECRGLAVVRGASGFEVVELHGGDSSTRFAYRVVAKRKGFEEKRLEYCKAAETDSYLYPKLREEERREHEQERVWIKQEYTRIEKDRARMEEERTRLEEDLRRAEEERARFESEDH
jgi:hypothetical protein